MSRRTYPVPNKNLSGSDYIQNKRAKQLFSGTSNLAKTIEEQDGNFPLLTPQGKLKPYEGTYGLSGRSVGSNKSYCLNTSHSYRDLLDITKGKYLLTPPNISDASSIKFNDVSDAKKLYNGVYYTYTYNTSNALVYMYPGYPDPSGNYIENKIEFAPSTDASQRIIVDPSYTITYSSQSCILNPSIGGGNVRINNDADSRYSFNRTINLDLLAGFQYPVKFELDYNTGDCINANNDIQTKYSFPIPPTPPVQLTNFVAGGQGINQAILGWSDDGVVWQPSNNGNTIFKSQVSGIKFNTNNTWLAVGGNSTDPSGNVIAYSIDGVNWTKSFTSNPAKNANNLFIKANGVEWVSSINKWIVVGQPKIVTDPSGVVISSPSIVLSSSPNDVNSWNVASSTDPSLNNPFGVNGVGYALATNNSSNAATRIILAVGSGQKASVQFNMVTSSDGENWAVNNFIPFSSFGITPNTITYAPSTISTSLWLIGGSGNNSYGISPIYYSTDSTTWSNTLPILGSGGYNYGTCYDIGYAGDASVGLSTAKYVAVGISLFGLSNIVYSNDGINWSQSNSGSLFQPRSVSWVNFLGLFIGWVVVGTTGGYYAAGYSTDGINWSISPNANGIFVNGALSVGSVFGV